MNRVVQRLAVVGWLLLLAVPSYAGMSHGAHAADSDSSRPSRPMAATQAARTHPLMTGSITAAQQPQVMADFIRAYGKARQNRTGTIKVFRRYLPLLGAHRIVGYFEQRDESCHGELHNLGKVIARQEPDLITAMGICADACTYACQHGLVKTHFADRAKESEGNHLARIQRELEQFCAAEPVVPQFYAGNCAHSAGHAYAMLTNGALPPTLALCSGFEVAEMQFYCETGVFMQLIGRISRTFDGRNEGLQAAVRMRMEYCVREAHYISACMRFVLTDFRKPGALTIISQHCSQLEGLSRQGCFNGLGFLARGEISRDPAALEARCHQKEHSDRRQCISGAVFAKTGHRHAEAIAAACAHLGDSADRRFCATQHGQPYYRLGNPTLDAML